MRIIWLLAAMTHFSTGCIAPMTAASEMSRRWCAKNDVVAVRVGRERVGHRDGQAAPVVATSVRQRPQLIVTPRVPLVAAVRVHEGGADGGRGIVPARAVRAGLLGGDGDGHEQRQRPRERHVGPRVHAAAFTDQVSGDKNVWIFSAL